MEKIVVLNAGKKNGNTSSLAEAFAMGAAEAGNEVRTFSLLGMRIGGCTDCQGCARKERGTRTPCVIKDDMTDVYGAFIDCDVVVFASPEYWWDVSGVLKTAVDRLYAVQRNLGARSVKKRTVLLMTAGGDDYHVPLEWYSGFSKWLGWEDLGAVLGTGREREAHDLGLSIKGAD